MGRPCPACVADPGHGRGQPREHEGKRNRQRPGERRTMYAHWLALIAAADSPDGDSKTALWAALIGAVVGGLLAIAGGLLAQLWRDGREARAAARAIWAELASQRVRWWGWIRKEAAQEVSIGLQYTGEQAEEFVLNRNLRDLKDQVAGVPPLPLDLDQKAWDTLRLPVMRIAAEDDQRSLAYWYADVNRAPLEQVQDTTLRDLTNSLTAAIDAAERIKRPSVPRRAWSAITGWPHRLRNHRKD